MKISKLHGIVGKELKYKQLCEELNLKYKGGDSKIAQLKEVALYCNLQMLTNPTRYRVEDVYDTKLVLYNNNTILQEEIESLIIELFRLKDFSIMYMTNTQLLMSLYMVNNNYKVLKIPKLRKALEKATGEDYYELYLSAEKSGEILTKWVDRALERMEKRGLILYRRGYILTKETKIGDCKIYSRYEVPLTTPDEEAPSMEQRVQGCYRQALAKIGLGKSNGYIPTHLKADFHRRFNKAIEEEFDGEFNGGYKTKVIIPADPKRVKEFINPEKQLNKEAKRKVGETKQLDHLTGVERKRLLDEIISINPPVGYKEIIDRNT